jgi:dTDP-4-amino-4,6-dideoxygalactose transaminase
MMPRIPFNVPGVAGSELAYLSQVFARREFAGNGAFTARCHDWLKSRLDVSEALLTNSCTAALELATLLAQLEPGDEVIMPSFTFVATASAVVLRRATPVFVDIRPDTLNIDETRIEAAITSRTKAICVVHYAGVCAEMDAIQAIAERHRVIVIEDAAQALLSSYKGAPAGRLGDLGCFSFHESKNVSSGEGGALVIRDPQLTERAVVLWEKGTNRRAFRLGSVDRYSWVDLGSSFLPSEFMAAILYAQLEHADIFTRERLGLWTRYHAAFADLETAGIVRRPVVPEDCSHNGHLYYLLLRDRSRRDALIERLRDDNIEAFFHYIPLHSAPAGIRYGRAEGNLRVTEDTSGRLIRLPLHSGLSISMQDKVINRIMAACRSG